MASNANANVDEYDGAGFKGSTSTHDVPSREYSQCPMPLNSATEPIAIPCNVCPESESLKKLEKMVAMVRASCVVSLPALSSVMVSSVIVKKEGSSSKLVTDVVRATPAADISLVSSSSVSVFTLTKETVSLVLNVLGVVVSESSTA